MHSESDPQPGTLVGTFHRFMKGAEDFLHPVSGIVRRVRFGGPAIRTLDEPLRPEVVRQEQAYQSERKRLQEELATTGESIATELVRRGRSAGSVLELVNLIQQRDSRQAAIRWEQLKPQLQETGIWLKLNAELPDNAKPSTYSVADLLEMTGTSSTTLNQYAKRSGVRTPGRGKRNHRYTTKEARAILQTMFDRTGDGAMKARCREGLTRL